MAYERDRGASRGVGAIAAIDNSTTERHRQQRIGRATQNRDRRMVALSMGAFGSDHRSKAPTGAVQGPVPKSTSSGANVVVTDHRTGKPSTPAPGAPPPAAAPGTYPSTPTAPSSPVPITPVAPTTSSPTTTAPTTITVSGGAGGTSTTSGSGSGMTGSSTAVPVSTLDTASQLPDVVPTSSDDMTRNLMIAGGVAAAALAAYLIFRRPS